MLDWLIGFASERDHPLGFAALFASALLEYVFPPFPGDTITLFGAVLITAYGWSAAGVFGAVLSGSVGGGMLAYALGRRLRARQRADAPGARRAAIDRVIARFERHGPAYLVVNRFLPGLRAFFFVAAGMAGMRARDVLLYGAISAALWNAVIIGAGAALGANLDTLERWVTRYSAAVWIALGAALVGYLAWRLVRRHRRR